VITVESILVRSLDVDFYGITWRVKSTMEDIFDYTFQVLRSEAGGGPFEAVSPELQDQYIFIDKTIRRGNDFREWFYKILVKSKLTGDVKEFGPANTGPDADLIALEIRKHMNLLFREFIGRRCWVFPVRTFGSRCRCWDPVLSQRTQSHCPTCFDTGFVRGYHTPVETWISLDPDQKSFQDFNVGPTQQSNTTARLGYFPPLKPRDIIVEPENIRWRVLQVSGTEQVRASVHQEIQIHRIPSTDIEYKMEFDIGGALPDIWLSPARNYSNPQNLENITNEEFPKIYQLYPSTYPKVRT
jgi:hypothetical protein